MKDKELKLNASGYYDEPCYKAITASPKPGEIWTHNQSGAYMLVMANVDGVCPTLRLNELEKVNCYPVTCRTIMYANPAFMGYVFETNLSQYVKTVKDDEFKAVKQGLADMLGIACGVVGIDPSEFGSHPHILEEKVETLEDERKAALAHVSELKKEIGLMQNEIDAREKANTLLRESLDKVSREAETAGVYKELYNTLMDKVISVRGVCVNE